MITALAGGVGAAKLLTGLSKIVDQKDLTIIVNTGDDIQLHGLHISPDLDIIAYSLAGIVDDEKGWGIKGDTFHCLNALKRFNDNEWFNLGDKDLATHIFRTNQLREGRSLTEITAKITAVLGVKATILPMTNEKFETRIKTKEGTIHFEEYMVKREAKDEVRGVEFFGVEKARPAPGVLKAIENAELLIICPSNPIVSIGTILSVKGIREAIKRAKGRKTGVSPIISGAPVKGPADKLMRGLGLQVSVFAVAKLYADILDTFVIDTADVLEKEKIEKLGMKAKATNTLMKKLEDKINLAKIVLED